MHNVLSSLTVLELKLKSVGVRAKMDIIYFQSQQVREDDRCSSWREVICFYICCLCPAFPAVKVHSALAEIYRLGVKMIPLHLKKYKSARVIYTFDSSLNQHATFSIYTMF